MLTRRRAGLNARADTRVAKQAQRFFQTGLGQYVESEKIVGIRVPVLRCMARKYRELNPAQIEILLRQGATSNGGLLYSF